MPLKIELVNSVQMRFLHVSLTEAQFLHLDQVEIYI